MKKVVVVESPSKSNTIHKYLGKDYEVLASFGHVRDLPSKQGSVDPDNHFAMVWAFNEKSKKHMDQIIRAVKGAQVLYLATDPDREGEAISWHVYQILKEKKVLGDIQVKRVVFYEVTKNAILEALKNPRDLNDHLVEAYLARRALDYLVGFTLSPVLWRKLPGSRSAGRVQSVALRLITDRELEIEAFQSQEYWTVEGSFLTAHDQSIVARLTHVGGEKLEKFSLPNEKSAQDAVETAEQQTYTVHDVQKKTVNRFPTPPFITSTLQQEASRKLGFNARKTMQIAQQLYEGIALKGEVTGLITYMRTDSVQVSQEAIQGVRAFIHKEFGDAYLPKAPRVYKSRAKNAQEAHEAIRPTDLNRIPKSVEKFLERDQFRLYELIWRRMVASQMENARLDQVIIDFANAQGSVIFRASGSTIAFHGFLKVYEESIDGEDPQERKEHRLPPINVGEAVILSTLDPFQHFTQPPPRYTEASLVKKLEELGIGRPSTYASIMQTLVDRDYVRREKKQLCPEARGRVVTEFLVHYFAHYLEFDFTAHLETQLDEISNGKTHWEEVLKDFWTGLKTAVDGTHSLRVSEVLDTLNQSLGKALLGPRPEDHQCPQCQDGQLSLKLGKFGAFIGCSLYPTCTYTQQLTQQSASEKEKEDAPGDPQASESKPLHEPKVLGVDPQRDLEVTLRKGPYGFYVQWGNAQGKEKPKRVSIPRSMDPNTVTLDQALELGALPRSVGEDPISGDPITAALGRFGPYVKRGSLFASLTKEDSVLTVSLERALELLEKAQSKPKRKVPEPKKASPKKASPKKTASKKASPKRASKKATGLETTKPGAKAKTVRKSG